MLVKSLLHILIAITMLSLLNVFLESTSYIKALDNKMSVQSFHSVISSFHERCEDRVRMAGKQHNVPSEPTTSGIYISGLTVQFYVVLTLPYADNLVRF